MDFTALYQAHGLITSLPLNGIQGGEDQVVNGDQVARFYRINIPRSTMYARNLCKPHPLLCHTDFVPFSK